DVYKRQGGMGAWFARFFRERGYEVTISGRHEGPRPAQLARLCPVVVIAVPMGVTEEVIREVGPHLPPTSLLMDLTSLKAGPVAAMLACSTCEVVGLHPLFGPATPSLAGENVIVCPGRGIRGQSWITSLLENGGARVTVTTPERHDEMMAVVQGLNHFDTLVLGLTIRALAMAPEDWERFSTPAFRAKGELIKRLFAHPELYLSLIRDNPHVLPLLERFVACAREQLAQLRGAGL
ncbi:MAG: prephenate dehydrogenase/arogenate dehydrogenase family protein, partial [Syntrophales bacterium]|nr:prephenate dehydrogenase/arogenate dehydrogenase family protein [Syntrophales bacterium]